MTDTSTKPILEKLDSGIALIRLGAADERVIILSEARLTALAKIITNLSKDMPKGLIITGSSPAMFSAGADINVIKACKSADDGADLARKGQEVYQLIEDLKCPTIAAISGPCVGGACELAIACDYRVISTHPKSSIGLPEVKIGILPGFGGTQRLPRLIGLPQALNVILKGKVLKAKQALKVGLVDKIISPEELISESEKILLSGKGKSNKVSLTDKLITKIGFLRKIAAKKSRKAIYKSSKNFYPAPYAALEATLYGLSNGLKRGYEFEAQELGRLIITPECKSLTNLFFLTENSKGIGRSARDHVKDLSTMVIGGGIMGAGIAGELARCGYPVILKDMKQSALDKAIGTVKKNLSYRRSLSDSAREKIVSGIQGITEYDKAGYNCNFVIEAIFENIDLKKKVLSEASKFASDGAIIASNTSSLSVSEIASELPNPELVVGMHFFNPVPRMPLVEIIRGKETSNKVICIVAALASKMGKFPIVVEDVPGFLINRILVPYLNEAAFLLQDGYQIEDIDKAATDFGLPMGPVRLLDEIGLDVATHVSETLVAGYGKRMEAPQYTKTLMEAKYLGKKSQHGFYNYVTKPELANPAIYEMLEIKNKLPNDPELIQKRLLMSLINEAVLCLDEGVAGKPGAEAAKQIDLGTVMGTGFPPFRGGLMYYASSVGAGKLVNEMQTLERQVDARFRPVSGILSRAEKGISFYE